VVYESLPDSATVGAGPYAAQAGTSHQPVSTGSGLPSADQLAASGIPVLNLDLHVYATKPADRLVFINSRKYREGDTLQEGPVIRQITPAGVVLEYQGRSYLLAHD
jgi:general secretion pathway protein B